MTIVHYYLGRPARVWIAANPRRSPARQAHKGSGRVHSGIPGQPARGFTPSAPAAAHGPADAHSRRAGNRKSSVTATSDLPPAPVGGLLARRRIAIARFGGEWPPRAASARPWPPDWTRPITRSCPEVYPRPGNAPRSTWGYVSGTRSYTGRRWPNCAC